MTEIIIEIMNRFGYLGVFLLIAVENIFPPIPSEVILTFGGFMTTFTTMNVPGVVFFSTLGSVVGAVVLYYFGRIFSVERLEQWLDGKLGKMLHLKKEDVQMAQRWFDKRGPYTVFFCRFIPIVRSLISIPAGMAKMGWGTFLTLTTIGTAIWNIVLVYLGSLAGENWESIAAIIDEYSSIVFVILAITGVLVVAWFVYTRFIKNNER